MMNNDFDIKINASDPFIEYLVIHMLNGIECVDFSAFPEAYDHEYQYTAWHEATYQNPLVLYVKNITLSNSGVLMTVSTFCRKKI